MSMYFKSRKLAKLVFIWGVPSFNLGQGTYSTASAFHSCQQSFQVQVEG